MNFSLFSLKDKVIVVTGASSGIGRQCAITCSQMGATLVLLGRNQSRLNETFDLLENNDGRHLSLSIDLLEYQRVSETVKNVVAQKGEIHGLINCAGISTTLPLNAISPQKMDYFFQTNVVGAINLTKQFVRSTNFSRKGGSVVFISSVMGVVGEIGKTIYSMTKSALIVATKSISLELAPRKIRVNCISPGVVESPMSRGAVYSRDEESLKKIEALHPLGLGKPEDVANACVFLLSDESRWITGINLIVDGGYLAR